MTQQAAVFLCVDFSFVQGFDLVRNTVLQLPEQDPSLTEVVQFEHAFAVTSHLQHSPAGQHAGCVPFMYPNVSSGQQVCLFVVFDG